MEQIVIAFGITALAYGAGPTILAFAGKKVWTSRGVNLFSVVYTVVVFIAFNVLRVTAGVGPSFNTTPALVWGLLFNSIAHAKMKSDGRIVKKRRKKPDVPPASPFAEVLTAGPSAPIPEATPDEILVAGPSPEEVSTDKTPQEEPVPAPQPASGPEEREETCLDLLMRVQQEEEDRRKEEGNDQAPSVPKTGRLKVLSVLLGVACLVLLAAYLHLYSEYKAAAEELMQAQERIETQKKVYNDNLAELVEYRRKLGFWERNAVVVTVTGEKYHDPDCPTIRGSEFYIYDVDTAEWLGYKYCHVCKSLLRYKADDRIPE